MTMFRIGPHARRGVRLCVAVVLLVVGRAAAAPPPPPPPLHIEADNVTGTHGPGGDEVLLNGNVRIRRSGTLITSDAGHYLRAQGLLLLDGHVKMVDSTTTVTCDHASFDETKDLLTLLGNVEVHDRNGVLRSPFGTYDRAAGKADLSGPVEGRDSTQRLYADHAIYWRDSMLVQARGRVRGFDDPNRLELNAGSIDYDRRSHVAVATERPVMKAKDKDGRITEVRARLLRVNSATRVAEAVDSVTMTRDTLQARADHARFDDRADRGWLTGSPRVWDNETEATGDSIEIHTRERSLQRVIVLHHAVMDYKGIRPSSKGETSRLLGDRVDVFFRRDDIDSLVATGDARNEYAGAPVAGKTQETNLATGDTITVFFKDRKIDRAKVQGKALGEYQLAVTPGDTTAFKRERVKYDARTIEFQVPRSRIVLDQAAHLIYQDLELHARRVVYDVNKQTLVAEGEPKLLDRGNQVGGTLMTYELESREGTIYQASTAYEKGLYHGEQIRKVGDRELDVLHGAYSTCDLAEPHYHFSARWMKIYLKDKLVAKPVVFYIRNVPILALPFWVFPIKPGRHSGFLFPQFELGLNSRAGQFIRNAGYYWAPNDYMDLTTGGDYYQDRPSWVLRAEGNYALLYRFVGSFRSTFAKDEFTGQQDWDLDADHNQEISPRTRLTARGQFVSSRTYNSSDLYGRSLAVRLNRFLTSNLSVSHVANWASFSFVVDRRQDLDADFALQTADPRTNPPGTRSSLPNLTQFEPSLAISFPTRTLGTLGFLKKTPLEKPLSTMYFSLSTQFLSLRERRSFVADTVLTSDSVTTPHVTLGQQLTVRRGLATSTALSDSRRLFGWLNFAPRLNANMVVFDFDELGHKIVPAATWSSGASISSSFYGTFRPALGPLIGLRHVIFPSVSLSYSPAFDGLTFRDSLGVRRNRFNGFGGIAISGFEDASMNFQIDQRFQAKIKQGDNVQRLDNLLSWTTATHADLLWRQHGLAHPFSPITSGVFLQPPGLVNANLGWTFDPYAARRFTNLSYNLSMNLTSKGQRSRSTPDLAVDQTRNSSTSFTEDWSLGLAWSYSGGYAGPLDPWTSQKTANVVGRWQVSPGWGLEYSTSADVTNRVLTSQRFALTRDLHCWTAAFTRVFIVGGEAEYYFRISVKDQKEIYLERGSRIGSLGGIQ